MRNNAEKSELELNTARKVQADEIAQAQLKTANAMEALKQNQFATKTQPEVFNMQKKKTKQD